MNIAKRIDRAFQWAGEKIGAEAKTVMSEEFKMLELEMALRFDGLWFQCLTSRTGSYGLTESRCGTSS